MRGNQNSGRWLVAAISVALLAPLTFAGKPGGGGGGGGSTPPADPAIACVLQKSGKTATRDLVVMNADGTNLRTLVSGSHLRMSGADWSPDGSKLVFLYDGAEGPGVYVVGVDGAGLSKVVSVDSTTDSSFWWTHVPRWSPAATADGASKIAYVTTHEGGTSKALWVVNLDGTDARQLTTDAALGHSLWGTQSIAWAPGADRIATGESDNPGSVRDDIVVHELELSGGALEISSSVNVTDDAAVPGGALNGRRVSSPSWSRSGDRIAVDVSPASTGDEYSIWAIDLSAPESPDRVSPSGTAEQLDPCWSPDDAKLVVSQWNNARCIDTMGADGSGITQIAKGSKSSGYFTPTWRRNE